MAKRPLDVLHSALNQRVVVEVRGGRQYRGLLDGYDHPHLNLVVREAEEVEAGRQVRKGSKVIVRGDSIVYIQP